MSPGGEWTDEPCRNCGNTSPGRFCPECGQRKGEVRISLRGMLAEVLEDQLSINATLPRTLIAILFHPGRLTNEYLKGRIATWIPPFRLYLATSVAFFLALSLNSRMKEVKVIVSDLRADSAAAASNIPAPTVSEANVAVRQTLDSLRAATGEPDGTEADAPPASATSAGVAVSAGTVPRESSEHFFGITLEPQAPGDTVPWTSRVRVNTGLPRLDAVVRARVRELGGQPLDEAASSIMSATLDRVPTAMFVLVPVFAALLAILYFPSRRYYVEHFVFALHYHAFVFLLFLLLLIGWGPLQIALWLWMGAYLWLAMRKVYGQSRLSTTFKWVVLSLAYMVILGAALVATTVAAILLL